MRVVIWMLFCFAAAPAADFTAWMDSIAQKQLQKRRETIAGIKDADTARKRQSYVRSKFLELIGGLPEYKGPLNPKVTGSIDAGEYVIEKVIFESFPQYFVTGNVYRPKANGRYPAVLFSLGHWMEGKAAAQIIAANLALNGFVVLAYDPMGQGERLQAYDKRYGSTLGSTDQHILAGAQALLTGRSMASYMIFDSMRSIDYLISRPDVDPDRIGASGCSGGGTQTTLVATVDPRVKVSAPACYITTFELLFKGSVGDSEQSTPGFIASGFDQADFIESFAPKPWLIASTREDFFPLAGAEMAYKESKQWYGLFGAEDRIAWAVGPGGHGTPVEVREAIYNWMSRWLRNSKDVIRERPVRPLPDHQLWATATGQVSGIPDSRELWQVIQAESRSRPRAGASSSAASIVGRVNSAPRWRVVKEHTQNGILRQELMITVDEGLEVPATLLSRRSDGKRRGVVVVETGAKLSSIATELAQSNAVVLALQPRGVDDRDDRRSYIPDWLTNTRAMLIGLNLPALRARDVLAGVSLLASRDDVDGIAGAARGSSGVWMLMAAAADKRLSRIWLDGTPYSFKAALDGPLHRNMHDALFSGMRWEIEDLVKEVGEQRIIWTDPTNWVSKTPMQGRFLYRGFEEGNRSIIENLLAYKPSGIASGR